MRIAFVTPEYITEKNWDGGLANHLGRVCPALAEMGHEVVVVVASHLEGKIIQDGVEVCRVRGSATALSWMNRSTLWKLQDANRWIFQSWAFNRAVARFHRDRPFDLVQYASYTATGLFRLKSVPSVVRVSSYEPLLQKAYEVPATPDNRLRGWLDKVAIRRVDGIFGPSRLIAEVVEKETGRPVEVIEPPFTLDRREWDEQPYRDQLEGKKYLLFFGTLGVLKGVCTIAEVLQSLLEANPELNLVLIGKNTNYQGRPIIDYVWEKAGSFRGRVLYLGKMKHCQLHPIISHATAVVLPSRIDNLPNTCLEAMALKRIVIGSRGASFEQLIEDGKNGFLCPPDSPEELLAMIKKALELSASERRDMGDKAAKRVEKLRPETAISYLVDYYRDVIASC